VSALREAEELLAEQLAYATATGNAANFVKSACNFSRRILGKDNEQAMEWLSEALQWEPHNPYVHSHLASCLKESGRVAEAEATLWKAVRRFPAEATLRTQLADVLKVQDRHAEAEAEYRAAVRLFPDNRFARSGLAEVLLAQGRLDEAEKECRKTKEFFPGDAVARSSLARVLLAQGKLPEAEAACRETKRLFPTDPFAYTGLAEVLKARGALDKAELDKAEVEYRQTIRQFPREPAARSGYAEVLKAQGRLVEAEAQYREAKRLFPGDPYVRNGLAEVLKARGQLTDAEAEYRETMALFPHHAVARNGLAEVLRARGYTDAAETLYRHTKREFPANLATRCGLGHLLRRMARRDAQEGRGEQAAERRREAHALFQSVLQERPADSYALAGEGFLLLDEGRPQEAIALFEDACRRYPGLEAFAYGLMRARRESGECIPEATWESLTGRPHRIPGVFLLEHARASLAAGNLEAAGEQVRRLYEEFKWGTRPHKAGDGDVSTAIWYVQSLGRLLFGDAPQDPLATGPNIEEVVRRLGVASTEMDEITEQCAMAA
jgi:tetratricopeptide (TPR) repeat protein